jgi:phage terminase small subunit
MIVRLANGSPAGNPYLIIADRCLHQIRMLWGELGLTPSARARLTKLPTADPASVAAASKWGHDI